MKMPVTPVPILWWRMDSKKDCDTERFGKILGTFAGELEPFGCRDLVGQRKDGHPPFDDPHAALGFGIGGGVDQLLDAAVPAFRTCCLDWTVITKIMGGAGTRVGHYGTGDIAYLAGK
jgi:hypothetical protein